MIEDNWEPTQDDIDWTKEHYERMQVGDTWGVADAVIRKDEDELVVIKATPQSILPLQRIAKVCHALGIKLSAEEAEMVEDSMEAAQETAQSWAHEESGELLVNFDLEEPTWLETEQGEWRVLIKHEDGHEQHLSPMDYHLLAGDDLFFSWRGMQVLERNEIIDLADESKFIDALKSGEIFVMPTEITTHLTEHSITETTPPHLRGLIFRYAWDEEE